MTIITLISLLSNSDNKNIHEIRKNLIELNDFFLDINQII